MTRNSLRSTGSTSAWRRLRAHWADKIAIAAALGDPIRCWRTGKPILPTDKWDLGHTIDRADGGTDNHAHPEHASPNRAAGARRSNSRPRTRRW